MEFFAVNGKRPVRSSENTRKFAFDSVNHKYGRDTLQVMAISMDDVDGFEQMTPLEGYDKAIEMIAQNAPIRICEHERISGAASLGHGISHKVPVTYKGELQFESVSHLTIDFPTVLKRGINGIVCDAQAAFERHKGTEREPFARSVLNCLHAFKIWHQRYLDALKDLPEYEANYRNLQKVPFEPAENFYEAVQSLWFTFAFVRLCGNWPGIGRIDWMLGDFLKKDLENGSLTLDEAREILAHFFVKGCEWVHGLSRGSGDAQHYQNLVLAGIDEEGNEVTNEVTFLVLDIIEEFGISDFPTTVRLNKNSDPKLLERVAEVMRYGGGVLAVYNEDLIIDALVKFGYQERDARRFANDGCWEVQVPGETAFGYIPFDALGLLQQDVLHCYKENVEYENFEQIYNAFLDAVQKQVRAITDHQTTRHGFEDVSWGGADYPCTIVSIFEKGCIEKGLSYLGGGPVYKVNSPHIGGLPDAVNSLYAIKKLVYEDKKVTLSEFIKILKNNWEGAEALRQYVLNKYTYYGNDNDEVDFLMRDVIAQFSEFCSQRNGYKGFLFPAGVSTFGRQLAWSPYRFATPYGKKANEVLAGNCSPTPGTDCEGATAIIKSYCKADLTKTPCGAALDVKLLPSAVNDENGIETMVSLLRGFVTLGGFFMQLDIADTQLLLEAQKHPEDYQTMSVRVSGWNARFVTLDKEWQDMIIGQTGSDF